MGGMSIIPQKDMVFIAKPSLNVLNELILSESDRAAPVPGRASFKWSSFLRFPLNTKKDSKTVPAALAQAINVTVVLLGGMTACGLLDLFEITAEGLCSGWRPVSSKLYMK